jgi:fructose-bisphosphate aldolase class II
LRNAVAISRECRERLAASNQYSAMREQLGKQERSCYEASMTLVRLTEVLSPAAAAGIGLGAFNVFSIEHAEALTAAAEVAGTPVVLQISQNAVRYHGALAPIALATLALARSGAGLMVVHLDHATDAGLVDDAADLGFGSVMFDASRMPYAENVAATAEVVRRCHDRGLDVEAELGEIGGKDGVHSPGARTQPEEARGFVEATGVDALAVAVGSSHAMTERRVALDLELISELRAAVPVPLVLHGSSGVPDEELVRAVRAGMTKINIATHLNQVFTNSVRSSLADNPAMVDSRIYLGPARDAVAVEAARLLRLLTDLSDPGEL